MTSSIFDVPGTELVKEIAKDLKQNKGVVEPKFVSFVKTGRSKERAPSQREWYYLRMASILRRIYVDGPLGVGALRTYYGGKKNRGVKPEHFYKAGGKIIRSCIQQLEKLGFVEKIKKGRKISGKGTSYLEKTAKALGEHLKQHPIEKKRISYKIDLSREEIKVEKEGGKKGGKGDRRDKAAKGK